MSVSFSPSVLFAARPAAAPPPRFRGGDDALLINVLGDSVDLHPEENRFLNHWMPDIEQTRRFTRHARKAVVRAVEERTGRRILDFGNATDLELAWALKYLVYHPDALPAGVRHVVIGHGEGQGKNWRFKGSRMPVSAYIDQHVPWGEQVWAIVCDKKHKRHFLEGEGQLLVSGAID